LNNVVRHSKATLVHVRLGFRPEDLLLEVEDNGMGMQLDQTRRGIGMVAMRERAELLGGSIQWLPSASGGTVVRLEIPQEQLD
jgi:signal transduction histidine kinase